MKLERLTGEKAGPALGAWFGGVLVAGAAVAALWLHLGLPTPLCLFKEWTGIPCPTCGATRMIAALLSGNVLGAAALNPMLFVVLCGLAVWSAASTVRLAFGLPVWRVALAEREKVGLRIMACSMLAAHWAYLIFH
jgi:hypothetical protein